MMQSLGIWTNRNRFLRFLLAGAVNTVFGLLVYAACILANAPMWLALLIGAIAGATFNFFTTGGYVFRDLSAQRAPLFVLCYFFVYGANLMLLEWLAVWLRDSIVAQAILALPMAALSYTLMAQVVFRAGRNKSQ